MDDLIITGNYEEIVKTLDQALRISDSYDLKKRIVEAGTARTTIYYLEGFQNGKIMGEIITYISAGGLFSQTSGGIKATVSIPVPALDVSSVTSVEDAVLNVLCGKAVILSDTDECGVVSVDARTYPVRTTSEPENDRVMRGARDGFVEILLQNVTLIRRRIRETSLTVRHITAGESTKTDLAVVYVKGKANDEYVNRIISKLENLDTGSLVLGHQSVVETLIRKKWFDPFPKIRATERPDAASAAILEGSIIILCDNSPEALILPTSVFDFLQVTDDYYFPPLTGTYLRILRHVIFAMTIYIIPLWYLLLSHSEFLPEWLSFVIPSHPGDLPILLQILLAEFAIDGLKLASLNTPNMLSGSLSIVGGLLLGDFAVQVGWLCPDVILYMAFVAIANFTQTSFELGYAFKYLRIITLILTALFDVYGFAAGAAVHLLLLASNSTFASGKGYMYPLIPLNKKALARLLFRLKKED